MGRHLPTELVVEILLHLPPKPLFRNKSVSKKWLRLISDPFLAAAYQSRYPPFFAGFIDDHPPTTFIPHNTHVAPPNLPLPYTCYGSSNSLLLILDLKIRHGDAFSVLNPITRASVEIPEFRIPDGASTGVYGFICNLGHNGVGSYKVFVLSPMSPSNRLCIATFSSDTREWGTFYIDLPRQVKFTREASRAMVASDGIIYLIDDDLVPDEDESDGEGGDRTVVFCNPTEGSAEMTALPSWDVNDDYFSFSMLEYYDGSLSVCMKRMGHLEVWVLSRDKTWTMKHRFSFGFENHIRIQIFYFCKEDRAIYLNTGSRLVRCYYEDEQWRFEDVWACGDPCELALHVRAFTLSPWPISLPAVTL